VRAPPRLRFVLLILVAVFTIALFLWRAGVRREPTYNGKTLTHWAEQYGSNNWRAGGKSSAQEAQRAIRQIGTNGIPYLLELMRHTEPSWKKKLRQHTPQSWHTRLRLTDVSGAMWRVGAHGLAALGTNAPGAVPDLIQIATTHPDEDDGRYVAVYALRTLGRAAEPAIPFFIVCLTNKSSSISDEAALALGIMHVRPEISVPALLDRLNTLVARERGGWEMADVVFAVGEFGTNASAAVPVLTGLLEHRDSDVRARATNALARIRPAGKTGR
jgi:HEAT repeat protein